MSVVRDPVEAKPAHAARVLRPDEPSGQIVSIGSHVVLDDLDDSTREEYILVSSAESNPAEGRLSNESPVGKAIAGHHKGDVVDARAPRRVRHLRIADVDAGR
jgi:transcription elongation factor GreA